MSKPFTEVLTLETATLLIEGAASPSGGPPRRQTERELLVVARAAMMLASDRNPTVANRIAREMVGQAWEDHCARLDAELGISPRILSTADGAAARNPR